MSELQVPPPRSLPKHQHDALRREILSHLRSDTGQHRRRLFALAIALVASVVALVIPTVGLGRIASALRLDREPQHSVLESEWRAALEAGVAADPDATFRNLPPEELRLRLDEAGAK